MYPSENNGYDVACRRIAEARREKRNELTLKALGLREVPESVGELHWLKALFLHHNSLSELPDSIGALRNLKCLHLDDNNFTLLPEVLTRLERLEELYIEENHIRELPETLALLRNLCLLRASRNLLETLPDSLGQCAKLTMLDVAENKLTELPRSLRDLATLKVLTLHDNPALNIPAERLGPSWRALVRGKTWTVMRQEMMTGRTEEILNYYFTTRSLTKRPLNEAKLILVGRGGAGKTSLRKRLTDNDFDEGEDKTPGIQVVTWSLPMGTDNVTLHVWDFGGQEIMHATHQFFLTKRSLYLLVINAREGEQDANVEHWLRLVEAYGEGSPVILAVNKSDQHRLDLDQRGLRAKFPCLRRFVYTDCKTRMGLEELRTAIEEETTMLPDLRTLFPETWFALKKKLEGMPQDCITYDAYQGLCVDNREADTGNQEVLIDFLNDLGSVLYFRNDVRLCALGVLKPDWVTQGIYGLINSEALKAAGGVMLLSQLCTLLDKTRYPKQQHYYLIALMEKFELCFEMSNTDHRMYLIPELLPKETPQLPEWRDEDVLGFEYHYNILPEGLVPRFIVRTHALSDGCARWRHGVELRTRDVLARVRADVQEKRIFIAVRGLGRQPRDLLAVIRREFEEIHSGIKGLVAAESVPVPGYPAVKLDYRKLLVREANGKTTVEFETDTQSVELPLGKLLDSFEEPASRHKRTANIIVREGGTVIMPRDLYDYRGATITNSIVGGHMENVQNYVQTLPQNVDLRAALEELTRYSRDLLQELPEESQVEVSENLDDFVKEATKPKPRTSLLKVTGQGLVDAATTVAALSTPIIATVEKLRGLLSF